MPENNKQTNQEEEKPVAPPNPARFQYGALAAYLLEKDPRYVGGALEVLAGEKGLNLGEDAEGFVRGTQASEEGIKTASFVYGSKYQKEFGRYKVNELGTWYEPLLEGLEDDEKNTLLSVFNDYGETVEDMRKKARTAKYILDDPNDYFTDNEKKEARKTLAGLKNVSSVMNTLDGYFMEYLRPDAVDATRKDELKGLAAKLKKGE